MEIGTVEKDPVNALQFASLSSRASLMLMSAMDSRMTKEIGFIQRKGYVSQRRMCPK